MDTLTVFGVEVGDKLLRGSRKRSKSSGGTNPAPVPKSQRPRLPDKTESKLEELLWRQILSLGLTSWFHREYYFAGHWKPRRYWRFDFAIPVLYVGVEVEGGIWSRGRHVRGAGYEKDCEKYNAAAVAGWRVLRFTERMIKTGQAAKILEKLVNEHGERT